MTHTPQPPAADPPTTRTHIHQWSPYTVCSCPDPETDGLGPQREAIQRIARAADGLTAEQVKDIRAARDDAFWGEDCELTPWFTAMAAAATAVKQSNSLATDPRRSTSVAKALFDHRPHGYPRPAGAEAGRALLARDLIGDVFTQEHYEFLTSPWRKAIGSVHPDDVPRPGVTNPMTATTTTGPDTLGFFADASPVLLGAALKDNPIRVLFHYGEDITTVHSAGMLGTSAYGRDSTATLYVSGKPSCAGITDIEVHATPEQADYARRVLTLLLPYLPDESRSSGTWVADSAQTFLDILTARAERHVWCIRADNGRTAHASASPYSDYDFTDVVSRIEPEDIGLDDDEDPDGHVNVERVPESDLPQGITIEGARWPHA